MLFYFSRCIATEDTHAARHLLLYIKMPTYYKKTNGEGVQVEDTRIAVVMVGLPARGKSLIAQKGIPSTDIPRFSAETDIPRQF